MKVVTMKQARRMCPKSEPVYVDGPGGLRVMVQARKPLMPFREWARARFEKHPRIAMSPKLRRIVMGAQS